MHCLFVLSSLRAGTARFLAAGIGAWLLLSHSLQAESPGAARAHPEPIEWTPSDAANSPMGEARGLFPGRVVWTRNPRATPWNGDTGRGHWWEEGTGVVRDEVDAMLSSCLRSLVAEPTDAAAWDALFRHFNRTHGRGNSGYRRGEIVAIKTNCNNSYEGYGDQDNQIDAVPQTLQCMLRQLVLRAGVPQENIIVYEAARVIPDRVYAPGHKEFPGVRWLDTRGDGRNGREKLVWHGEAFQYSNPKAGCGTSIPEPVFKATYLINMALLKGHLVSGVTLTAKNHYGSIDGRDHREWLNAWKHGMGRYSPLVDLIGTRELGGKTLLYLIDGLFGTKDVNDPVDKECAGWKTLFGGGWSASLFLSQDPVAIDSVGLDFLRGEWGGRLASSKDYGRNLHADNYLHEAALAFDPPSGTLYQPDGVRLESLGVHEHWNDPVRRQYSRNLRKDGRGIELVTVESQSLNDERAAIFDSAVKSLH